MDLHSFIWGTQALQWLVENNFEQALYWIYNSNIWFTWEWIKSEKHPLIPDVGGLGNFGGNDAVGQLGPNTT